MVTARQTISTPTFPNGFKLRDGDTGWWRVETHGDAETVDDLAGLKIRVPGAAAYSNTFKALGAAPVNMQYPEVYSALQTKIVDGQENPLALIAT